MKKKYKYGGWSLWNFADEVSAPISKMQVYVETLQVMLAGTAYFTENTDTALVVVVAAWVIKFILQGICLEEVKPE